MGGALVVPIPCRQTVADAAPLRITSKESQRAVASNHRAIMFSYGQRETFKEFVAAVQAAWEAQRRADR